MIAFSQKLHLCALVAASTLSLWVSLAGTDARAQSGQASLIVRAAEHPSYSRLVIPIEPGQPWALTMEGKAAKLRIENGSMLDTSSVFQRMARTRILSVRPFKDADRSGLDLTLGCDCEAVVEQIGSRFLALDVRRRENGLRPDAEIVASAPGDPDEAQEVIPSDLPVVTQPMGSVRESPSPAEPTADSLPTLSAETAIAPRRLGNDDTADPLGPLRASLIEQLNKAAAEGLLDLDPNATIRERTESDYNPPAATPSPPSKDDKMAEPDTGLRQGDTMDAGVAETDAAELPFGSISPQVNVRSALDRPRGNSAQVARSDRTECIADDLLDVELWVDDTSVSTQLGSLRRALVDQRQQAQADAVLELARFYVAIGFGAEALAVLRSFDLPEADDPVLFDLSRVVDGKPALVDGALSAADECGGRVSLWRIAGGIMTDTINEETSLELQDALSDLPPRVRAQIGGIVSRKLIDAGFVEQASAVLNVLDRTPAPSTQESRLAEAQVMSELGREEKAQVELVALQAENSVISPDALKIRVTRQLAEGDRISPQDEADIDIEARRLEGSEDAADFVFLSAEIKAERGELTQALAMASKAADDFPKFESTARRLAARLLASANPEDVGLSTYGRAVVGYIDMLGQDRTSARQRVQIAQTLINVGLPNVALNVLATSRALPDDRFQQTQAQALFETGRPDEALEALAGIRSSEAARLRADALAAIGSYDRAVDALKDSGSPSSRMASFALLARDWETLEAVAQDTANPLGDLAARVRAQASASTATGTAELTLSGLRGTLGASEALRGIVEQIDNSLQN